MRFDEYMTRIAFAILLISPVLSAATAARTEEICGTPVDRNASHAALVKTYGKTAVAIEQVPAEAEMVEATVLFPDDPNKRVEIQWSHTQRRSKPATVTVRRPSTLVIGGVRTGATLADVEQANGGAFRLLGFGWDQGGVTSDWMGGSLSLPEAPCRLRVRFATEKSTPESVWRRAVGDSGFLSSDRRMRAVNPTVDEIVLDFQVSN